MGNTWVGREVTLGHTHSVRTAHRNLCRCVLRSSSPAEHSQPPRSMQDTVLMQCAPQSSAGPCPGSLRCGNHVVTHFGGLYPTSTAWRSFHPGWWARELAQPCIFSWDCSSCFFILFFFFFWLFFFHPAPHGARDEIGTTVTT